MPDCGPEVRPGWVPDWIFCPEEKILSVVVEWIIGGLIAAGNALGDAVGAVFASLGLAGTSAGDGLVASFESVAQALLGVAYAVNGAILGVAASSGPAGPVVVVVLYAGVAAVLVAVFVGVKTGVLWLT